MRTIYNGIDLLPIKTHEFTVEAVYDDTGVDYLYSRVTMVVEGLVNGQATVVEGVGGANGPFMSYDFKGDGGTGTTTATTTRAAPTPVFLAGGNAPPRGTGLDVGPATSPPRRIVRVPNAPLLTHAAVRHRLSQPRKQLYIFSGPGMESGGPVPGSSDPPLGPGELCVVSPVGGRVCDCKNGPFPKVLSVTEAMGDATTLVVTWAVETFINEAQDNNVNPRGALISNRFAQSHSVDDAGYTTIHTTGTALFRTDLVYSIPDAPDPFRAILFMPIPQGFTRTIDAVTGRPDVTGVDYTYTDKQVSSNFVAGPFVRAASISVVHRQAVTSNADVLSGALSVYERYLGIKANRNFAKPEKAAAPVPAAPAPRGIRGRPVPPPPPAGAP